MKHFLVYANCLLAFCACEKIVDLSAGDRQVVVECILEDKAPQTLRLSLTTGPSGIGPETLDAAVATLTDLTEQKTAGMFKRADDGLWLLDYAAIPEHKYRLEVEVPGYGTTVWAEDTMPPEVDIVYERWPFDRLEGTVEDIEYFYHDFDIPESWNSPESPFLSLYGNHDIKSVFYLSSSLPEHTLIQGFVFDENARNYRVAESLCTDSPGTDLCNLNGAVYVAKQWYIPHFSSSASRVFTREDATGLLLLNPKVDGNSCHQRFLKIEKEKALLQPYFTISGDFREGNLGFGYFPPKWNVKERNAPFSEGFDYLLFCALSENYNAYLNDATISGRQSDDLASLLYRGSSYFNIEGGVGIFGSFSSQMIPIDMDYTTWELYDY